MGRAAWDEIDVPISQCAEEVTQFLNNIHKRRANFYLTDVFQS